MLLKFTKMQGLGNDFVVMDGISQRIGLSSGQYRKIADRHFGIGCDQILLVEKATGKGTDFRFRIFNADGNEVEQCGNGARCFLRFVLEKGLTDKRALQVESASGIILLRMEADDTVTVNMGIPRFAPEEIPFEAKKRALTYALTVKNRRVAISALSIGNPHAVQLVRNVDTAPVSTQGPLIEKHGRFPKKANAGYMQVVNRGRIRLRVFERGVGETLSCGSGACAAVVAGIQRRLLDNQVVVQTRGGELKVRWDGEGNPVWMSAGAVTVFEGIIDI
ncbi:MAG TPA: diaminopimelate epimerase [Burkholderiales bacterium]|nr:diaminopimelate epimerase [Burkholderiales bacterium]